jgi:hypothetical protein
MRSTACINAIFDRKKRRKFIMDNILVVVFDNEGKAYERSRVLQDLHDEGRIQKRQSRELMEAA